MPHRSTFVAKLGEVNSNEVGRPPIASCVVVADHARETLREEPLHLALQRTWHQGSHESLGPPFESFSYLWVER